MMYEIKVLGNSVVLKAPYHPDLPAKLKMTYSDLVRRELEIVADDYRGGGR